MRESVRKQIRPRKGFFCVYDTHCCAQGYSGISLQKLTGGYMGRRKDPFGYFPINDRGQANPCFECGVETLGIHHVVPVSLGGTKVIPLCEGCHNLVHGGLMSGRLIREGLRKARAKGIKLGAPLKLTPDIALKASSLRSEGFSYKDIAKALDISVGSLCAVLGGFK